MLGVELDSIFVPERFDSDVVEHRRKIANGVNQAGEVLLDHDTQLDDHEQRIVVLEGLPTGIQGTYDQINDSVLQGVGAGSPLPNASTFIPGEYFELDAGTGLFTTPLPELNGKTGASGDQVVATSQGTWLHLTATGDYLSSVLDDTAKGSIQFDQPAHGLVAAEDPTDYIRKGESEGDDATTLAAANSYTDGEVSTHAALTATANDVHGSATYTNEQLTAHKGESAVDAEVHGVREYTQSVTEPIDQDLQAHKADTSIHFPDAPADGSTYGRNNNAWSPCVEDVPIDGIGYIRRDRQWVTNTNLAVLYGQPSNASLGTGGFRLVNWSESGDFGDLEGAADPVAGSITISEDAPYRITAHVYGQQGNDNKEESIWLQVEVVGGPQPGLYDVVHESVDTDKTSGRSLSFTLTRGLFSGEVIYLRMRASTGLGTFSFEVTTFEIEKLI